MSNLPFPAPVLLDTTVVTNFRTGAPSLFLDRMNHDLGLDLSEKDCLRLQHFFMTTAMRDPTVGELRVLNALTNGELHDPTRIAVGELTTSSPALAEIWADMMYKHTLCHGAQESMGHTAADTPPPTLTDTLHLEGLYLHRSHLRPSGKTLLLSDVRREPLAAAQGYAPVARVSVGSEAISVWAQKTLRRPVNPPRAGDFLLYVPRASAEQIQTLLSIEASQPRALLGDIHAVSQKPFLLTVTEHYPSVDLFAARLTEKDTPACLPMQLLCAPPTVHTDGACGYLLRVPLKQVQTANQLLKELGIPSIACGQLRTGGNTVIYVRDENGARDVPAVSLPSELLRTAAKPRLYAMKPESERAPAATPVFPLLARLPSRIFGENGLTPDQRETVALTRHEGHVLPIPEANLFLCPLTVYIPRPENAFSASADVAAQAARNLEELGLPVDSIRLSVTLSVPTPSELTDGTALSAICGIYCAASQLTLPVDESSIRLSGENSDLCVTVIAWAQDAERLAEEHGAADTLQRTNIDPTHTDAPSYVLPVLRRSYEESLKTLAAALDLHHKAPCAIRPLAMNAMQDETTDTPRYSLHPESEQTLLEELGRPNIPIFSMNESDTRLLLSHPSVMEALRRRIDHGWLTLALGESCKPFAELGLLPPSLLTVDTVHPTSDSVTVTYAFPSAPSTRLVRTSLLAPLQTDTADTERHLLALHLPDGRIIPDGFSGAQGKVLGMLNGLDTPTLIRLPGISLYL